MTTELVKGTDSPSESEKHLAYGSSYILVVSKETNESVEGPMFPNKGDVLDFTDRDPAKFKVWVCGRPYTTATNGPSMPIDVAGRKIKVLSRCKGDPRTFGEIEFTFLSPSEPVLETMNQIFVVLSKMKSNENPAEYLDWVLDPKNDIIQPPRDVHEKGVCWDCDQCYTELKQMYNLVFALTDEQRTELRLLISIRRCPDYPNLPCPGCIGQWMDGMNGKIFAKPFWAADALYKQPCSK